jgi:hypothetical protein
MLNRMKFNHRLFIVAVFTMFTATLKAQEIDRIDENENFIYFI